MQLETVIVSAIVGVCSSVATALITSRLKINEERSKWRREFASKYAEAQSRDPKLAEGLAKQFAVGMLIIEPNINKHRRQLWESFSEALRIPPTPDGGGRIKKFVPPYSRLTIGSGPGVDIPVHSSNVSEQHAAIFSDDSGVYVENLGTQSTYISRTLLREKRKLDSLDAVFVGATVIVFVEL
jgi:pSer/pThr/pTyr-binding forkhead associated (FHA) protein